MVLEEVQNVVPQTSRMSSSRVTMSPARDERVKKVELLAGEFYLLATAPHASALGVQPEVLHLDHDSMVGQPSTRLVGESENRWWQHAATSPVPPGVSPLFGF